MAEAKAAPSERVDGLDGLRAVALLLVLCFHAASGAHCEDLFARAVRAGASAGWIGVDGFFVLSGFVITRSLRVTRGERGALARFWMRRLLRIVPAYYALIALAFGVVAASRSASELARGLPVFVVCGQNWLISGVGHWLEPLGWLNHLWSLSVEVHFYLMWPWVVSGLRRRHLVWVALAMILSAPLLRGVLAAFDHELAAYVSTPVRMDALAMGALTALQLERARTRADTFIVPAGLAGAALLLATSIWDGLGGRQSLTLSIGLSGVALAWAALIARVARGGRVARTLSARGLVSIGRHSYEMYLVSLPLLSSWRWLCGAIRFDLGGVAQLALDALVVLGAAYAVARWLAPTWQAPVRRIPELAR